MFSSLTSLISGASPTVFPEIETVKDPQDCLKVIDKAFKDLLDLDNAPDWTPLAYQDAGLGDLNDIKLFDRVVPNSTVSFGKSTATIPLAPKALFEKFWAFNFEWIKTFDIDMKEIAKLLEVNSEVMLVRTRATAPFPVTPREFVLVRGRKEQDGALYIFTTSVNYAGSEVDAAYVRGVIPANGYIFRPVEGDPNKTNLSRVTSIDPKGAIPLWVIDMVKTKSGDFMARLRKEVGKEVGYN